MPLYTPGRRRAIVLLLLSSILLLTLDLRGNAIFDAARSGFNQLMKPLETAADVATKPIVNAWRGITRWEEVSEENDRLRDQLDGQRADQIAAQAAIQDQQELLAERDLMALGDYPRITATVVGTTPTNLDQVVQINKGRDDGIEVGMAVIAPGGLIGKITTPLLANQAYVMLATDARYATAAKVIAGAPPTTTTTAPPPPPPSGPPEASPSSVPAGEIVEVAPGTSLPAEVTPPTTPPPTAPAETAEATTTTVDMTLERDTGQFVGRGPSNLPQVDLLSDSPVFGRFVVGDLVFTAGGDEFLAPPDIPIGTVRNVIQQSSAQGPLLEVELSADLGRLHFVEIILYRPSSEAVQEPAGSLAVGD